MGTLLRMSCPWDQIDQGDDFFRWHFRPNRRMLTGQWNATSISRLSLIDDDPVFHATCSGALTIHVPELEAFDVEMGARRPSRP
jgi:hypothetical protein